MTEQVGVAQRQGGAKSRERHRQDKLFWGNGKSCWDEAVAADQNEAVPNRIEVVDGGGAVWAAMISFGPGCTGVTAMR